MTSQCKEPTQSQIEVPPIDRAKISVKDIGPIKAYAVNSHPGTLKSLNNDRICVVTNLNKASSKELRISFFSVYSCESGTAKAEFFRDHFHPILVKDKELLKNTEAAIRRTIAEVEGKYRKVLGNGDSSEVSASFAIMGGRGAVI
jgi:hypothetical protein